MALDKSQWKRLHDQIMKAREREADFRLNDARRKATLVSQLLRERYGATRVLLYGSCAEGTFHARSDIDLYVEGFSGPFWRMFSEAEALAEPFPVSIVCAEDASPSLRQKVGTRGVRL